MVRLATAVILVLALATVSLADGVMFSRAVRVEVGQTGSLAKSPKQEAVLVFDGETVEVILRTHFRAGPKEVAWLVPVPAKPLRVAAGRERIFRRLEEETAPRFYYYKRTPKLGCGTGAARVAAGSSVTVESLGTAGIFEWVVLSGKDAKSLIRWLDTNHFTVPQGAEQAFESYVAKGWCWLAMKVRPELTEEDTIAPHPVVYTYKDTRLVYPLAISRLSSDIETEVVLYVLAASRYRVENWANREISDFHVKRLAGSPSGTTYERAFYEVMDEHGGHAFVTEFANRLWRPLLGLITQRDTFREDLPATYLTRLRAVVSLRAMDRDVVLVPDTFGEHIFNEHPLAASATDGDMNTVGRLAVLSLALLVGLTLAASRRLGGRLLAVGCFLVSCLIIAS